MVKHQFNKTLTVELFDKFLYGKRLKNPIYYSVRKCLDEERCNSLEDGFYKQYLSDTKDMQGLLFVTPKQQSYFKLIQDLTQRLMYSNAFTVELTLKFWEHFSDSSDILYEFENLLEAQKNKDSL